MNLRISNKTTIVEQVASVNELNL